MTAMTVKMQFVYWRVDCSLALMQLLFGFAHLVGSSCRSENDSFVPVFYLLIGNLDV
jgi:hypothetical protein